MLRRSILFAFDFAATTCLHAVCKRLMGLIGIIALMGGIENLGSVDGGGIEKFLVVGTVGSSMGEISKEWGNVLGCGGR